jgi:UDP-N-acetylglucosamine--N-acetylmuramyl-(pentapeptide) pyrophosphoryl-undecaprenol N-acetylglucosamine transferase
LNKQQPYRFIITGGGTGGHIYPAIAVANNIKERYPDADILFVGAMGKMEMIKVPEAGYKIKGLWISGFQRRVTLHNILFPFKVLVSFLVALRIVKKFKPDAVIGFGGYASGPIIMAANRLNIPSVIQEQNSHAGMANRRLSGKVKHICVAYEGMDKYFDKEKLILTGNPVRSDILDLNADKKERGLRHYKLSEDRKTILILGGSLGARTINDAMIKKIDLIIKEGVQVIWQTGKIYHVEMKSKLASYPHENVRVVEFITDMDEAYACADVVISRAGALSISEICLAKKPLVLVPSPNVVEDHQTKNAMALVDEDAAILVEDIHAHLLMLREAIDLAKNEQRCQQLSDNIAEMAKPDAAKDIVDALISTIK